MVNIKYSQKYINVADDDNGEIETEKGSCRLPDEYQIETIAMALNLGDCKVDYYEYDGFPYISFGNISNWKVKYYTFNLFTLRPTMKSQIQRPLPKAIADELRTKVQYEAPKRTLFKDLTPSKEQLTNVLLNAKKDECGVLLRGQDPL
jgi:hypothetical protein